jgi:hypothetical protein
VECGLWHRATGSVNPLLVDNETVGRCLHRKYGLVASSRPLGTWSLVKSAAHVCDAYSSRQVENPQVNEAAS